MARSSTNSSKRPSQKTTNYQSMYLLIGLLITFLSLVTLFHWGFIGIMLANGLRLLVGETYGLLLYVSLTLGLEMIIAGNVVTISWRRFFGGVFVLLALAGCLHLSSYYDYFQNFGNESIFDHVFNLYRNDLVTQQNSSPLGGGLIGAALYQSVVYLFGPWGSYLFFCLVFLIGLILLIDRPLISGWRALQDLTLSVWTRLLSWLLAFKQVKEVFNQESLEDSLGTSMDEPLDQPDWMPSSPVQEVDPSPERQGVFGTLSAYLASFFDGESQDIADEKYAVSYMPTLEREEEPVFQARPDYPFEPYSESSFPIKSDFTRDQVDQGRILDMDFFDQMKPSNQMDSPKQEAINKENFGTYDNQDLNDLQPKGDRRRSNTSETRTSTPAEIKTVEEIDHPLEKVESTVALDQSSGQDRMASHWQEASSSKQNLTHDELDQLLNKNDLSQPHKQVPTSRQYQFPGKDLLNKIPPVDQSDEYRRINDNMRKLELTFESFGVDAKIVKANLGPSVTKYEIEPAVGVKVSKIVSLADDIALALAARDIRMEAPIPGKSLIGIEVPNNQVSPVAFSEIIDAGLESDKLLEVPLGRDISGSVCLADLSKMPHLLIAGATGSGKSVGVNVIICSLLMKAKPEEVKFLMIDPKKVELTLYNDLPHQLSPVVTNPRKAARALNNVVEEMERRYELFASTGVRNIDGYNDQVDTWNKEEGTGYKKLPRIVVIVDELADLMMVASNDVENAIIRLAQMARAAGIHMIIATQRPSVDVITGIIKANVPSRLAFAVSSGTDSRTILDSVGAEKLLGRGDMLFQPMGKNKPVRVQGAYISDEEVERITQFIKDQREAEYDETIIVSDETLNGMEQSDDEYYEEAVELLKDLDTLSISQLQRKFRIGYNRAARLIDDLEANGYVSAQDGSKPRQVLIESSDE